MSLQLRSTGGRSNPLSFTPTEIRDWNSAMMYDTQPVQTVPVYGAVLDPRVGTAANIDVNIPSNGMINKAIEFDINAARAGTGNLEIMVNDGKIPCNVQNLGNRQFHASFMPRAHGTYDVHMQFNGQPLPNSPRRVHVCSAGHMSATGSGLKKVPVGAWAKFAVKTGGMDNGDIRSTIISPGRRFVPNTISNLGRGDYSVDYVPTEVGKHSVEVTCDGTALPGSPFTSKVYDVNAIVIQPISGGSVGNQVQFTVDVTRAGEGQLEIMVDDGAVPNHVSMLRKGIFRVTFMPQVPRPHKVDIRFNGISVPSSPFMVPVTPGNPAATVGESLLYSPTHQAYYLVNTAAVGNALHSVQRAIGSLGNAVSEITCN